MATFLIGGSSFLKSVVVREFDAIAVDTTYGTVLLRANAARTVFFCQRHGADPAKPYSPPHLVNQKAIVQAAKQLGCAQVIAFGSVGSLKEEALPVGTLLVPNDYYNPGPQPFFSEGYSAHYVPGFNKELRQRVMSVLTAAGFKHQDGGVYTQTHGPRFETAAEIKALAAVGDVVGMTCGSEATLCGELQFPYALICMVDNIANGLLKEPVSLEEFHNGVARNSETMGRVLEAIVSAFPGAKPGEEKVTGEGKAAPSSGLGAMDSRMTVDLVVHARYVLPVEPAVVLEKHSVVVEQGKIVAILPTVECETKYRGRETVDQSDHHVLMPGFVNSHAHMGMTLLRGYSDDVCLLDWLHNHIWPAEGKFVDAEFTRDSTELAAAEMIRGGTTCINDMYFFPEAAVEVLDRAGLRSLISLIVMEFPTNYAKNPDDYIAKGLALQKRFAAHPRISFAFGPHAPYTVAEGTMARLGDLCKEHSLRLQTHLHETKAEVEDSIAGRKESPSCHLSDQRISPVANFDRMGLLSTHFTAFHMTTLSEHEMKRVAETQTKVVSCPSSNLKLASGFTPIAQLTKAGATVALGTDSSASNNKLDMMAEMRQAAIVPKGLLNDPTVVPAIQAITMATLNGAKACGFESVTGSLKVGKSADFITLSFDTLDLLPMFDVMSHVVYAAGRERVSDVWVCGRRLLRDRKLVTLDEESIVARARSWQGKLTAFRNEQAAKAKAAASS